ncbi:MAG: hypothetical protein ACNA8L_05575 [Luteolibacter sp.]
MKRIVRRVQTLNERAAELTAAAGQLPNRVAELREAMTATSGQLQTLKSDIQVNVADLKVEHETGLGAAIAEIAGHAPVLAEAGFLLDGLDVEVSPIQRIVVQLVRFKDVEIGAIQPLIHQYHQQSTLRAILSAILKARAMADTMDIDGLDYTKLVIGIGPVPSIRLCWRAEEAAPAVAAPWQPALSQPFAATASFFGPSTPAEPVAAIPEPVCETVEESYEPTEEHAEYLGPEPYLTSTTSTAAMPPPLPEHNLPHAETHETADAHAPASSPPPLPAEPPAPVDPLARFKVMPTFERPRADP